MLHRAGGRSSSTLRSLVTASMFALGLGACSNGASMTSTQTLVPHQQESIGKRNVLCTVSGGGDSGSGGVISCGLPPPIGSPTASPAPAPTPAPPTANSIAMTVLSDAAYRQQLASDSAYAASIAQSDANVTSSGTQIATDLSTVMSANGVQAPSQLNANFIYLIKSSTKAVSSIPITSLTPTSASIQTRTVMGLPGVQAPTGAYGGSTFGDQSTENATQPNPASSNPNAVVSPSSFLTGIASEYWISPVPKLSDTYIQAHAWLGATCAPDYLFGIIPIGGCAVAHIGTLYGPRFSLRYPTYYGSDLGFSFAQRQDDVSILNTGAGNYHIDGAEEYLATDGVILIYVHAYARLFS